MTPGIEQTAPLARPRFRWRVPGWSFRGLVAASAFAHALVLLGVLAFAPGPQSPPPVAIYTVRVVELSGPSARSTITRVPVSKAPVHLRPGGAPSALRPASTEGAVDGVGSAPVPAPPAAVDPVSSGASTELVHGSPLGAATIPQSQPLEDRAVGAGWHEAAAPEWEDQLGARPSTAVHESAAPSGAVDGSALPAVGAESLDPGFALVSGASLGYPEAARRARKGGQVRLELEVGPDGRVLAVRVLDATPGWGFAEAARAAYQKARFSPPRLQGRPVRVLWRKTLLFQP